MKCRILFRSVALSQLLLLLSCATPGVKLTKRPLADSPLLAQLLDPEKLTPETQAFLEERDLLAAYRKDTAETIAALRRELPARPSPAYRRALTELCMDTGDRLAAREPQKALGYHLVAAELAFAGAVDSPDASPRHGEFVGAYNHSCGQVARILFDSRHSWDQDLAVAGPGKEFRLRCRTTGSGVSDPSFFDQLVPAEYLEVKGIKPGERLRQKGIGAALVGHRQATPERQETDPFLGVVGMALPLTATLQFSTRSADAELIFHDTLEKESVTMGGRNLPLAIDYTAPLFAYYNFKPKGNVGLKGMLNPDKFAQYSHLVQVEPFRPDQIPVVLVHGLMSSPMTWTRAINTLRADPVLRKKYQILVFKYPTGFPISHSALALRMQLEQFSRRYDPGRRNPNMRRMILIGHSMGGMLTNLQIRDSGDMLADLIFTHPLDELDLDDRRKEALRSLIYFEANPDITRAVFVAAPHRGSDIAANPIGELGASLIRIPEALNVADPLRYVDGLTEFGDYLVTHKPNGVNGLRPNHPVFLATLEMPLGPEVTTHSVIGTHKPGVPLEASSDKVVPYWSSHLDNVASEKVVEATHTTITGNPEAIEELRRILYLHAGLGKPR